MRKYRKLFHLCCSVIATVSGCAIKRSAHNTTRDGQPGSRIKCR